MFQVDTELQHCFEKSKEVLNVLKPIYPNFDDRTILNLSFRGGDQEHSQWTVFEESILIPYLVNKGDKPLGSLCSRIKSVMEEVEKEILENYPDLKTFIMKNVWGMWCLVAYKDDNISKEQLVGQINETNTWQERGILYGYR